MPIVYEKDIIKSYKKNHRILKYLLFSKRIVLISQRKSARPAPCELPQGGNAARAAGCSGAMRACFFSFSFHQQCFSLHSNYFFNE